MKKLSENIETTIIDIISKINDTSTLITQPDYHFAPKNLKEGYLIRVNQIDKLKQAVSMDNFISPLSHIEFVANMCILKRNSYGKLVTDKTLQIKFSKGIHDIVVKHLSTMEKDIVEIEDKINDALFNYGISKELPDKDIASILSNNSRIDVTNLKKDYMELKKNYEACLLLCDKLVLSLKNHILENEGHKNESLNYLGCSIIGSYINFVKGYEIKSPTIFDYPIYKTPSNLSLSHIDNLINNKDTKPRFLNNLIHLPINILQKIVRSLRLFTLKVVADTVLFFKGKNEKDIDQIRILAEMTSDTAHLRLRYAEIDRHSLLSLEDKARTYKKDHTLKKLSSRYSLSKQDLMVVSYLENTPLSLNVRSTNHGRRFSLLNGVSLISLLLLVIIVSLWIIITINLPETKLNNITVLAEIQSDDLNTYGVGNKGTSQTDGMVLSSNYNGKYADNTFLSEIKLTTSSSIDKYRNIQNNITSKIRENEEQRKMIPFDEDLQGIRESISSTGGENKRGNLVNNNNNNDSRNNANESTEQNDGTKESDPQTDTNNGENPISSDDPLSLPDYSKLSLEIMDHDLDLSIKDKKFDMEDYSQAIVNLQEKIDLWYDQARNFFEKNQYEYEISEEHQKNFLGFIKSINPVKVLEAYNYQFQNFPYLLDRISREDMPNVRTSVSADALELGLWGENGIGIFYDISSFDTFHQVFIHEFTHDIIERAYGTPIILEGVTEMIAINISSYLFGEGFTNYKGPVSFAQYLYNRNSKALIDYYIGRTHDDEGLPIDLFDKEYIVKNFLNEEVDETVSDKNTEFVNSMMDIDFDDVIKINRIIIPLNEIINANIEYTPLVLQSDFNYKGCKNKVLKDEDAILNLENILIKKLREYVKNEKKVEFYTLLSMSETIRILLENKNLSVKYSQRLNEIVKEFKQIQKQIVEKDLLYKQNELSEKSKDIAKKSSKPTPSDMDHQNELNRVRHYKDNNNSNDDSNKNNILNEKLENMLPTDQEEIISNYRRKMLKNNIAQDMEIANLDDISESELEHLRGVSIENDLNKLRSMIESGDSSVDKITDYYNKLSDKWGSDIEDQLNNLIQDSTKVTNKFDIDEISALPEYVEILKKRFDLMEKNFDELQDINANYRALEELEDENWLKILSLIDDEEYLKRYYAMIVKALTSFYKTDKSTYLFNTGSKNKIKSMLVSMRRIASFIDDEDFTKKYRDDIKNIVRSVGSSVNGIKRLSELNKHIRGNVHPYVKSEVVDFLDEFIIDYINNYPIKKFNELLESDIIKRLDGVELYKVLSRAIQSNIDFRKINDSITLHEEIYSQANLMPLTDEYLSLYERHISSIIRDSRNSVSLNLIYNTERLLLTVFSDDYSGFDKSDTMTRFYRISYNSLSTVVKNSNGLKNRILTEMRVLNHREKYMMMFHLSSNHDKHFQMSYDSFNKIYNNVFLKQLNLYESYSENFLRTFLLNLSTEKTYANNMYSLLENTFNMSVADEMLDPLATISDYIALLDDEQDKKYFANVIVNFVSNYYENNIFRETNLYFTLITSLGSYISRNDYVRLITLRYQYNCDTFKNIPYETELLYLIMNMLVNHPSAVKHGLDEEVRSMLTQIVGYSVENQYDEFKAITSLYVQQIKVVKNRYLFSGSKTYKTRTSLDQEESNLVKEKIYMKSKILHYESSIVGMIIYIYNDYFVEEYRDLLSRILNLTGAYMLNCAYDLTYHNKKVIESEKYYIGDVLKKRYTSTNLILSKILSDNPTLLANVEELILSSTFSNDSNTFIFFMIACEGWFWKYFTLNDTDKNNAIITLSEDISTYGKNFSDGFVKEYMSKILFSKQEEETENLEKIKNLLLLMRDNLLPFVVSKEDIFVDLLEESIRRENKDSVKFLFQLMACSYFDASNYTIDFFVEGELIRRILRKFFLSKEENYDKLFFLLPKKPTDEFGHEEELRRDMINYYYHIFQSSPDNKYLENILSIYKTTLEELINGTSDLPYENIDERIEEEFSKISNLIYLINDNNIKLATAEEIYPLLEEYIASHPNDNSYLFANYVKANVKDKSSRLKWNILDSMKSDVFNYKNEASRHYRKLFDGLDRSLLELYAEHLRSLIQDAYKVPPTEYRILLETISEDGVQDEHGLKVMEEAFDRAYKDQKRYSLSSDNLGYSSYLNDLKYFSYTQDQQDSLKYIILSLKNLIPYSSDRSDIEKIKNNISSYSRVISSMFREIASNYRDNRTIRSLVGEMATEIIKLPPKDKYGLFSIFSSAILDYEALENTEYKYYTTLLEYLIDDLLDCIEPSDYSGFAEAMKNIATMIVYLSDEYDNISSIQYSSFENLFFNQKFEALMIMYSHYISKVGSSKESDPLNKYILRLYKKLTNTIPLEEEAIIASNLFQIKDINARSFVNEYLRTPVFRRYLEDLSDLDRHLILSKTQQYLDALSKIKTDYDNPASNRYLIEMLGMSKYIVELENKGYTNYEITKEIYKRRNNMVSRLTSFFTETYGFKFVDPAHQLEQSF